MFAHRIEDVSDGDLEVLCPQQPTREHIGGLVKEFRTLLDERAEITEEFREEAKNPTVATIMRFVRARKYDVVSAVQQFVDAELWYQNTDVASVLEEDPNEEIYQALCPHLNGGFDKHGRPIYWERTGEIRLPKVLKLLSEETLVRRHVRQQEITVRRMKEESERRGKVIDKQVVILDLKNMSFTPTSRGLAIFRECIKIDQSYYPETLGDLYLINAPWIFQPIWAILKPWLDPVTRAKFHVLGSGSLSRLVEDLGPEGLPAEYGGTASYSIPVTHPYTGPGKELIS
eukprot:m.73573 g.73573  ORF g.73573 m.73573 type:complete len:287 (-) comp13903_c0_seq1:456-1316(-)